MREDRQKCRTNALGMSICIILCIIIKTHDFETLTKWPANNLRMGQIASETDDKVPNTIMRQIIKVAYVRLSI